MQPCRAPSKTLCIGTKAAVPEMMVWSEHNGGKSAVCYEKNHYLCNKYII